MGGGGGNIGEVGIVGGVRIPVIILVIHGVVLFRSFHPSFILPILIGNIVRSNGVHVFKL